MKPSKVVYSLNVSDIQNVAVTELGRELTNNEIHRIEDKIGDHIDWYEAISFVITSNFQK